MTVVELLVSFFHASVYFYLIFQCVYSIVLQQNVSWILLDDYYRSVTAEFSYVFILAPILSLFF